MCAVLLGSLHQAFMPDMNIHWLSPDCSPWRGVCALIPAWWAVLRWDEFLKAHAAWSCLQVVLCFRFHNTYAKTLLQISGTLYSSQNFFFVFLILFCFGRIATPPRQCVDFGRWKLKKTCKVIALQVLLLLLLIIYIEQYRYVLLYHCVCHLKVI